MKNRQIKLNLGCGKDIKKTNIEEKWINLDVIELEGVDVVHDLEIYPLPFKNNTFDYVYADNVIEHLDDITKIMKELHRICKNRATIEIKVPYYNSKGAYNDVTHKHYFNSTCFEPFYTKKHRSEYDINSFNLIEIKFIPTRLGKLFFPNKIRMLASSVFGEILSAIELKLEVKK